MPQINKKCQPAGERNSGRPVTSLLHCNTETDCPWKHDNDDDDIRQSALRKNDEVDILLGLMQIPRYPLGIPMLLC